MELEVEERKRKRSADLPPAAEEEEDNVVGPMPAQEEKGLKKRKGTYRATYGNLFQIMPFMSHDLLFCSVLPFEKMYLDNLPCAEMYEKSYMHRDVITHVLSTKYVCSLATPSC